MSLWNCEGVGRGCPTAVEGSGRSLEDFKRQRGHDVGLFGNDPGPLHGLGPDGRDQLSPVDEGQPFFGLQLDGGQVVALQHLETMN